MEYECLCVSIGCRGGPGMCIGKKEVAAVCGRSMTEGEASGGLRKGMPGSARRVSRRRLGGRRLSGEEEDAATAAVAAFVLLAADTAAEVLRPACFPG